MKLFLSKLQKVVLGKITNHKSQIINSQAGVTLLLAILILSSVLAISFSLATIMFIEVRSSGDLLKTEPALYAATGVGEQAFFNLERSVCTATSGNCSYTTNFANNVQMPNAPTILSTTTPIFIVKVKAGSSFDSTLNKYDFCDTTAGSSGCNYGKVIINYITTGSNGGPLYAYLCEFDPNSPDYLSTPCTATGTPQNYWEAPADDSSACPGNHPTFLDESGSLQLISYISCASWAIAPAKQQQLILTNPGSQGDIFVKITTFAPDGVTGKGLPFVGKTAVSINTQYASVGRKIQVVVPNSSATTGGSSAPVAGQIIVAVDNGYTAYFNGSVIGSGADWMTAQSYPVTFQPGKNVVAFQATNAGGPAGLLAQITEGSNITGSSATWKVSTSAPAGWEQPGFDDSSWSAAIDEGSYGSSPWFNGVANMANGTPAHWIWTNDSNNTPIYFRVTVNN